MYGSRRVPEPLYAVTLAGADFTSFEFSLEHARRAATYALEAHPAAPTATILTRNTGGAFTVEHEVVSRPEA